MKNVLILGTLLFSINGFTQITTLRDKGAVSNFNLKTMELFKNGEVEQAFQAFYTYWAFADTDLQVLESKTLQNLNYYKTTFGKCLDYERYRSVEFANSFVEERYLLRYENTALRFIFTFYKSPNGYILNAFKWDTEIGQELEKL